VFDFFELAVTSVERGKRAPGPEIFRHTLQALGASAWACVYVGDSHGVEYRGARATGMPALLIDPLSQASIPGNARLGSVFEFEARPQGIGVSRVQVLAREADVIPSHSPVSAVRFSARSLARRATDAPSPLTSTTLLWCGSRSRIAVATSS
jgi:hypothetical protein